MCLMKVIIIDSYMAVHNYDSTAGKFLYLYNYYLIALLAFSKTDQFILLCWAKKSRTRTSTMSTVPAIKYMTSIVLLFSINVINSILAKITLIAIGFQKENEKSHQQLGINFMYDSHKSATQSRRKRNPKIALVEMQIKTLTFLQLICEHIV